MRQQRLPSFVEQQARFGLRFTCEHCTYFHVEHERCMHGYPNAEHREARAKSQENADGSLVFCKEFELV